MLKSKSKSTTTKSTYIDEDAKFVEEKLEEARDWKVLRQVQINRAFFRGDQWIKWDKVRKTVYVPELKENERRYTYNKIKPAIMTLLAKLTKNRVQLEVHPDTNDDKRIEVAKAGHKFLRYQWQEDNMDHKTRRLKLHMLIDGFPALKVFADKTQGKEFETPDGKVMRTGKIVTLVVDQMRLFVDPTAEDVEEIRWVVEEFPKPVDEIEAEYGVKVEPEEIVMRQSFEFWQASDAKKKFSNHAMVREYWELPCAKYPNGRKITTAGGKVLDKTDNPGEFPYIFFPMIPVPGRAVADGVVKDMTTPQMSYNIKRTAEARLLEELSIGKWMVPINSLEDESELTDEIAGIIHYTPVGNMKPTRENGPEPGAGWQNAMERDEADMEDISGAHEISQGSVPKGVDTYGGLQLLVEQDETKLAIAAHSFEEGIKKWGEKVLRLVKKHFPEEQQLQIVGENGEIEAFTFSGADLTGGEVVDVIPGSSMPEVRAVKEAKIMQMWNAGMFVDPKTGVADVRKVARLLGQSISSAYYDDYELHENKAKMEQRQWEQLFGDPAMAEAFVVYVRSVQAYQAGVQQAEASGLSPEQVGLVMPEPPAQLPIVRDFYDHQTHLECHNRFRLSKFYDSLPPELQSLIDLHCAEHEQAIMAPQLAQQEAQAAADAERQAAEAENKQRDHERQMEREALKAETQLQLAALRGGRM